MTDEELKEQRDAVLKGIYELKLLRPTLIGLLKNYERWIVARSISATNAEVRALVASRCAAIAEECQRDDCSPRFVARLIRREFGIAEEAGEDAER